MLAKKGAKHVMKRERGTKTQIMVLGCANAAGDFMSPYLVYPGQLMTVCMGYENFPEAIYTQTENGWMDTDSFFELICYFDAWVKKLKIYIQLSCGSMGMCHTLQHKWPDFVG